MVTSHHSLKSPIGRLDLQHICQTILWPGAPRGRSLVLLNSEVHLAPWGAVVG